MSAEKNILRKAYSSHRNCLRPFRLSAFIPNLVIRELSYTEKKGKNKKIEIKKKKQLLNSWWYNLVVVRGSRDEYKFFCVVSCLRGKDAPLRAVQPWRALHTGNLALSLYVARENVRKYSVLSPRRLVTFDDGINIHFEELLVYHVDWLLRDTTE